MRRFIQPLFFFLTVIAALASCGDREHEQAVLETNTDIVNDGGGGGDSGKCTNYIEVVGNELTLSSISGSLNDVEKGETFVVKGGYKIVSPEEGVYILGRICGTMCRETKHTPPIPTGEGSYTTEFEILSVIDQEEANSGCVIVAMIDEDSNRVLECTFYP